MQTAIKQASQTIGPQVRFSVAAEEVEVKSQSTKSILSTLSNGDKLYSTYRFRLTRLSDGVEIRFEARYSELRGWYSDLKNRGVISDERIGIPFPGKHLIRNLKLGGVAAVDVKTMLTTTPPADDVVNVSPFVRASMFSSSMEFEDNVEDDYSATALVEKRRRELCQWIEALLWRYPNLLKDAKNTAFISSHKVSSCTRQQSRVPSQTSPPPPPYTVSPIASSTSSIPSSLLSINTLHSSSTSMSASSEEIPPPLPRPLSHNTKSKLVHDGTTSPSPPSPSSMSASSGDIPPPLPSWLPRYEVLFPANWNTTPSDVIHIEESINDRDFGKIFRGRLLKAPSDIVKVQEKKAFGSTLGIKLTNGMSFLSWVAPSSDDVNHDTVAVKIRQASSKRYMDDLRREVEALTVCASPLVAQYLSCFLQPKTSPISGFQSLHSAWLVYEWSVSLKDIISKTKLGLSEEIVMSVLACAALALRHVHSKGYMYLNLHVGSVCVMPSGVVKLTDFSCARSIAQSRSTASNNNRSSQAGDELLSSPGNKSSYYEKRKSSSVKTVRVGEKDYSIGSIGMLPHYLAPELASALLLEQSMVVGSGGSDGDSNTAVAAISESSRRKMIKPGHVSVKSDVWALGILGYECVQCSPPHAKSGTADCLMRISASSLSPTLRLTKKDRRSMRDRNSVRASGGSHSLGPKHHHASSERSSTSRQGGRVSSGGGGVSVRRVESVSPLRSSHMQPREMSTAHHSEAVNTTLESLLVVNEEERPTMLDILAARSPLRSTADGVERWGYTKALRDWFAQVGPVLKPPSSKPPLPVTNKHTSISSDQHSEQKSDGAAMGGAGVKEATKPHKMNTETGLSPSDFEF